MLVSVISVSVMFVWCVGSLWLSRYVGRCVVMNVSWKLYVKKFVFSS